MDAQPLIGQQERIDDIPLLIGLMGRMNLAEVLDKHLGRHHLHQGLSNGQLAVGWIAYILSQSDHRKYAVQDWAEGLSHTLESLFGCPLRPHEFSDDDPQRASPAPPFPASLRGNSICATSDKFTRMMGPTGALPWKRCTSSMRASSP